MDVLLLLVLILYISRSVLNRAIQDAAVTVLMEYNISIRLAVKPGSLKHTNFSSQSHQGMESTQSPYSQSRHLFTRCEGRKEMFYLTTHSTHFIYGYMASDIW